MPEQDELEQFYEAMSTPPSDGQAQASGANTPPGPNNMYKKALLKGDVKIDKLGEHSYQEWSETMRLYLSAKVLFDKVDGFSPVPTKPFDPMTIRLGNLTIHRGGCEFTQIANRANKFIFEVRKIRMLHGRRSRRSTARNT